MKITIECECGNKECRDTKDKIDIELDNFSIYTDYEHDTIVECLKCDKKEIIE